MPFALVLIPVLLALGHFVYATAFHVERRTLIGEAAQRLDFYTDVLERDLGRIEDVSYLMGHDADLAELLRAGRQNGPWSYLSQVAMELDLAAIALYGASGERRTFAIPAASADILANSILTNGMVDDALKGSGSTRFASVGTEQLSVSLTASPVRDAKGTILGVALFAVDLTPIVRSWDRVGEMVFLTDGSGVIVLSSDPTWRGMTTEPEFDHSITRFPMERLLDGEIEFIGSRYDFIGTSVGNTSGKLNLIVRQDGARNYAESVLLLVGAVGLALAVLMLLTRSSRLNRALEASEASARELNALNRDLSREIAERRAAEHRLSRTQDELARASRLADLGQFASAVTHELGQPITAMDSYLTVAEHRAGANPPAYLARLRGLVLRMQKITEDLKHFSRRPPDLNQTISAGSVLRGVLALLDSNLEEADVTVDLGIDLKPALVRGDALRLEQAVTNIVRNAIDAMRGREVRHLDLRAGADDGVVRIEVGDTGPGLGGCGLERLTEPFFTASTTGQGMGLGLSIASDIVREHGGHLKAVDRPSGGATFEVTLPRHDADSADL